MLVPTAQRTRLFVRRDPFDRFVSCLVFVPREKFNTDLRVRIQSLLKAAYHGTAVEFTPQLSESMLARIHITVRTQPGNVPDVDVAELEDRKLLLGQKRKLIDRAFEQAYAKLLAAPAAERRTFFLRQVTAGAAGHETLAVGETACDWFDDGFLADANRSLAEKGKPGALTLAAKRVPGCAGVVLTTRGAEVRCTFEALIEEARAGLEQQVADTLFPAQ